MLMSCRESERNKQFIGLASLEGLMVSGGSGVLGTERILWF